jgi:hypothetical protein
LTATEAGQGAASTTQEPPKNDFKETLVGDQVTAAVVPPKTEPIAPTNAEPAASENETAASDDGSELKQPKKKNRPGSIERRAIRLERENEELRARLAANPQPAQAQTQQQPATDDLPTLDRFETWDKYQAALTQHTVKAELLKREQAQRQQADVTDRNAKVSRVTEQLEDLSTDERDLLAEFQGYRGPGTAPMAEAILDSEISGRLVQYVLDHPEEAAKMAQMSAVQVARHVGKLETQLEAQAKTPKPAAKTSNAPPPIEPVRASAGTGGEPDASKDFDTWHAWDKARRGIQGRR